MIDANKLYVRRRYTERHSPVLAEFDGTRWWTVTILANGYVVTIDDELFHGIYKRASRDVITQVIRTHD